MSNEVLTKDELIKIYSQSQGPIHYARAIEQAVILKLRSQQIAAQVNADKPKTHPTLQTIFNVEADEERARSQDYRQAR